LSRKIKEDIDNKTKHKKEIPIVVQKCLNGLI